MATVNIHDAKTHFSRLLRRIESGEEIIIAKAGKSVARIIPLAEKPRKRVAGSAKGRIILKSGFLAPLPNSVLDDFEKSSLPASRITPRRRKIK